MASAEESKVQNVVYIQKSRKEDFSCYSVMPLLENCYSTSLFTTGYKRLTEGGREGDFLMGD
jgi:hypothetical protein